VNDRELGAGDPAQPDQGEQQETGAHPAMQAPVARPVGLGGEDGREADQRHAEDDDLRDRGDPGLHPGRQRLGLGHQDVTGRQPVFKRGKRDLGDVAGGVLAEDGNFHTPGCQRIEAGIGRQQDDAADFAQGDAGTHEMVFVELKDMIALADAQAFEAIAARLVLELEAEEIVGAVGGEEDAVGAGGKIRKDTIVIAAPGGVAADHGRGGEAGAQLQVEV